MAENFGSAYGSQTYGQGPYGATSFDTTGPSLVSVTPVNGATGVANSVTIIIQLTSPAELDVWSLGVTIDGAQAIAGGEFLPSYGGNIEFNGPDATITISTHPVLSNASHTISTTVTDLANVSNTFNSSFTVNAGTSAAVSDTVTVSDAVTAQQGISFAQTETVSVSSTTALHQTGQASPSETVSVSSTTALHQVGLAPVTDSVSISDAVAPHLGAATHVADTVSVTSTTTASAGHVIGVSETVPYTENVVLTEHESITIAETITVTDHVSAVVAVSVAETVTVTDSVSLQMTHQAPVADTVTVSDSTRAYDQVTRNLPPEVVAVSDSLATSLGHNIHEHVPVTETVSIGSLGIIPNVSNEILLTFSNGPLRIENVQDVSRYAIEHVRGVPVLIESVTPHTTVLSQGTGATATPQNAADLSTNWVILDGTPLTGANVGDYLHFGSEWNAVSYARIVSIVTTVPQTVLQLDKPLLLGDPLNGSIPWTHTTGVQSATLKITKATNGGQYILKGSGFTRFNGDPYSFSQPFSGVATRPQVKSVEFLSDGDVLVTFSDPMLGDRALTDPGEYRISGTTDVEIVNVRTVSPTQIMLITAGLSQGNYTLTVNAHGTPKDSAGNPIDPSFNTAVFNGSSPVTTRSIYTDKGPIAKPPLTIQSGIAATITGANTLTLTGATLSNTSLGKYVSLSGSASNDGEYQITAIVSPTKVRVRASFALPDAQNSNIAWVVFDPRDGQVADDPADVSVKINGNPVTPDAVIGLLGQIVLPTTPLPTDDVKVDYSWISNPTVDFRRLNSKEFRLNGWNRDVGFAIDRSRHAYRYNNTLIRPSEYVPDDMQALLDQPLQRDLKYRAYERAYTAVLNDPNLLKLNSPIHKIAFPALSRTVSGSFVSYAATTLPENDPTTPWVRHGQGAASIQGTFLVVQDAGAQPFPGGQPIFWTRPIDLMFDHVFAASWRMLVTADPVTQGVFTGVAAGYSDGEKATFVGYLDDNGVKKIGFLKAGGGNDPSDISAWGGGLDGDGNPTGEPVEFDWSVLHSYRLFRDKGGVLRLYIDGDVVEVLRTLPADLPFLEELDAPFDAIEGVFFGSFSRPATNTSQWEFFLYNIQPTNPLQTATSVFVTYEATVAPEQASQPWTPVGFAGTETILSDDYLLLDSTSATDTTSSALSGLIGGNFKGFDRIEPLLSVSSDIVLDVSLQVRTHTHGITPNAIMAAVDDGQRLMQLSFFPDQAAPKFSYGGHSLPDQFSPVPWISMGSQPVEMRGRHLRISDSSTSDGRIYYVDDTEPPLSSARVVSSTSDYILEFRAEVISYTADGGGFCGVTSEVYDGLRSVGVMLREVSGVRYVAFHSDGTVLTQFSFNWFDGEAHTYRAVKNTTGDLVTLFVDGVLLGSLAYSSFTAPGAGTIGVISFGSSTSASNGSKSVVDWVYTNCWRVLPSLKRYVGLWKGRDSDTLMGYHLPLHVAGRATVAGNAFGDTSTDFIAEGVTVGDYIVIDDGPNKGAYKIASVSPSVLTITGTFPVSPSEVAYRIPAEMDWTTLHRYRIVRGPNGDVVVLLDTEAQPIIRASYNEIDLPLSAMGVPRVLAGALPSMCFGAFDPTNVSQSVWDYVRYGITRSPGANRIAPHHEFINQRNVMASPEHLFTNVPHTHTDFWSSSTGIPPQIEPDFQADPSIVAFTLLNEGTPLYPKTQTFEVRNPTVQVVTVAGLNRPEDVLNSQSFVLNEGDSVVRLVVPDDVLYNALQVTETSSGSNSLIAPFFDEPPDFGTFYFQKTTCLTYDADTLPENDPNAATPWVGQSDTPAHVSASAFNGILTYGTDGTGSRTIYRNATPLPDSVGLTTQVKFRLKLLNDSTSGNGDSKVRFGFSAPGMTLSLAFVTTPLGERYVLAIDQNTQRVVGGRRFDFLDGNFHDYRLVRDPSAGAVQVFIDS